MLDPVDIHRHVPALPPGAPARARLGGIGEQFEAGHGGDAGQGLAAEAQGGDRFEVVEIGDLAGGVAAEGQGQIIGLDAGAIVPHPDQLDTPSVDVDVDAPGTGIQAVFHQFLDHRGGTLHHFAGGDLVGKAGAEQLYSWHGVPGLAQVEGILMRCPTRILVELRLLWRSNASTLMLCRAAMPDRVSPRAITYTRSAPPPPLAATQVPRGGLL